MFERFTKDARDVVKGPSPRRNGREPDTSAPSTCSSPCSTVKAAGPPSL